MVKKIKGIFLFIIYVWLLLVLSSNTPIHANCNAGIIAYTGFEQNNKSNIFTVDLCTRERRQLTSDGESSQSVLSPDGTKIVFLRRVGTWDSLYVMNADGTNAVDISHDIVHPDFAAWSPEGTYISFKGLETRGDRFQLHVVRFDGTELRRVVTIPDGHVSYSTWSPDGDQIAFAVYAGTEGSPINKIDIVNTDGSNLREIPITGRLHDIFSWSPNGENIAYVADDDLFLLDTTYHLTVNLTRNGSIVIPDWSPNGQEIAFNKNRQIYVINVNNLHETQLTQLGSNGFPVWSPDGNQIGFLSYRGDDVLQSGRTQIYIMDADGLHQMKLTSEDDFRQNSLTWASVTTE